MVQICKLVFASGKPLNPGLIFDSQWTYPREENWKMLHFVKQRPYHKILDPAGLVFKGQTLANTIGLFITNAIAIS